MLFSAVHFKFIVFSRSGNLSFRISRASRPIKALPEESKVANLLKKTIASAAACLLAGLVQAQGAQAQMYGPYNNDSAYGIAPIYSNPVYQGDARGDDLYAYLHPYPDDPWNTYQLLVQQIAAQNSGMIGTPPMPSGYGGGGYPYGGAYTSVSGVVLP